MFRLPHRWYAKRITVAALLMGIAIILAGIGGALYLERMTEHAERTNKIVSSLEEP